MSFTSKVSVVVFCENELSIHGFGFQQFRKPQSVSLGLNCGSTFTNKKKAATFSMRSFSIDIVLPCLTILFLDVSK